MASPLLASRRRTSPEELARSWNARPGWGIAANLTPPELIRSYRLSRLRERILLAVCLVALLAAAGFAYGFWRVHQARDDLLAAQSQSVAMQHEMDKYAPVTRIQGGINQVRAKVATLLGDDIDTAALIGRIQAARPPGVAIVSLTATVGASANAGTASSGDTGGSLDTSGQAHIGSLQIQGTGGTIDDVPKFIDALAAIPGLVDVLPTSNATQAVGTTFTLTVTLTDRLLTHRFDVRTSGDAALLTGAK